MVTPNPQITLMKFHITYSIITEESAMNGDHAAHGFMTASGNCPRKYSGYIPKNPHAWRLRDAVEILRKHDGGHSGAECDCYPVSRTSTPRWIIISDYCGYRPSDCETQLSLHVEKCTPSTAVRIARLLGVKIK